MGCPCEKTTSGAPLRMLLEDRVDHLEDVQKNVGMIVLVLIGVVWLLWNRAAGNED